MAAHRHPGYENYVRHWPIDYRSASRISELPFLPVGMLKANPPLAFIVPDEVKRTLTSSATTSQSPSRVVLDAATSRRMTKGVVTIVRDYIGTSRRPYLVVDTRGSYAQCGATWARRGAAIQGLHPFASQATYCLHVNPEHGDLRSTAISYGNSQSKIEMPKYWSMVSPYICGIIW